jgi:hypothetical protein
MRLRRMRLRLCLRRRGTVEEIRGQGTGVRGQGSDGRGKAEFSIQRLSEKPVVSVPSPSGRGLGQFGAETRSSAA